MLRLCKILTTAVSHAAGSIPPSWSGLKFLTTLELSLNTLIGTLPSFSAASSLVSIYVDSNNLEGTLPAAWSSLTTMENIDLTGNQLKGTVPRSWGGLQPSGKLGFLSVAENGGISGCMPVQFESKGLILSYLNTQVTGFCNS